MKMLNIRPKNKDKLVMQNVTYRRHNLQKVCVYLVLLSSYALWGSYF